MLMGFEQARGAAEAQPERLGNVLVLPSESEVEQHEPTPQAGADTAHVPRTRKSSHHQASLGGVSKFAIDYMCMDETPATILVGYGGLTKAFLPTWYFAKARIISTQKERSPTTCFHRSSDSNILQSDQEPSIIIDVRHKGGTHIPNETVHEESRRRQQLQRQHPASQPNHRQIRAIKDFTEQQIAATMSLDSSVLNWLVRHAA